MSVCVCVCDAYVCAARVLVHVAIMCFGGASICDDYIVYSRALLFGGFNGKEILGDLYILDFSTFVWTAVSVAGIKLPPAHGHCAASVPGTSNVSTLSSPYLRLVVFPRFAFLHACSLTVKHGVFCYAHFRVRLWVRVRLCDCAP